MVTRAGLNVLHGGLRVEGSPADRRDASRRPGVDETTIGRVLNHARATVTAKHYNRHAYLDETRRALDAWDRELSGILNPAAAKPRRVLRHRPRA